MANTVTTEFRVSYPQVFRPKMNELSGQQEYSIVALFPKGADLSKLQAAAKAACVSKWGVDPTKWPKNLKMPFRNQGEKITAAKENGKPAPAAHEEGAVFMNLRSKVKPGVVDATNQPIIDESQFYAGCFARASVSCYAYDQKGNRGVSFGLQHLQKTRDGETLAGRPKVEDAFEPVESTAEGIF